MITKNLDQSLKTDLDLWFGFGRENTYYTYSGISLHISVHSKPISMAELIRLYNFRGKCPANCVLQGQNIYGYKAYESVRILTIIFIN